MRFLYPSIPLRRLPGMLRLALVGALIAGPYGALHDQISFTISSEYFTKMKFNQFAWANVGLPERWFVAEVGFLASWWAGFFAGWFLARAGLDEIPALERRGVTIRAFGIMLGTAVVVGALAAFTGWLVSRGDLSGWREWRENLWLRDVPRFVIVAWLHAGSYAGALIGLIAAIVYVRRARAEARGDVPKA